jgi:pentapeptide repeat protein
MSGADLTGAKFDRAQLQGAVFSDAVLTSASLVDAAVSILILTSKDATLYHGVPLFEVPLPNDALNELALFGWNGNDEPEYPLELATDGQGDYHDLITGLRAGKLDGVRAAFKDHGVTLSTGTTVQTVECDKEGSAWLLKDPMRGPGQSAEYTVWDGNDSLGNKAIKAQPRAPNLNKLFQDGYAVTLACQATILPIDVADGSKAWEVDNDSSNPENLQTGYMKFLVMQRTNTLSVFGTLIHATRLESIDKQEIGVFGFSGTVLCKNPPCDPGDTYLQSDTFCPNGETLSANLQAHKTWAEMMQVAGKPPLPPPCVPSPYAPCLPTPTGSREKPRWEEPTP